MWEIPTYGSAIHDRERTGDSAQCGACAPETGVQVHADFLESTSGDMILRLSKAATELDLVDHLRRFKGMEIPERKHLLPRM